MDAVPDQHLFPLRGYLHLLVAPWDPINPNVEEKMWETNPPNRLHVTSSAVSDAQQQATTSNNKQQQPFLTDCPIVSRPSSARKTNKQTDKLAGSSLLFFSFGTTSNAFLLCKTYQVRSAEKKMGTNPPCGHVLIID